MKRLFFFLFFCCTTILYADVYLLKGGGKIEGELLNQDEVPRKTYKIQTGEHVEIEIRANQMERHRKSERAAVQEYNSFAPFLENTIENHRKTADWCSHNQLPDLSKQHLRQILELDPEDEEARRRLGYVKSEDGSWTTSDEIRSSRGLIRHEGRWKTQQQIDVEAQMAVQKKKETQWEKRINALCAVLPENGQAKAELLAITDSTAAAALWRRLETERNPDTRILLIRAMSNIGTSPVLHSIARWSLNLKENEEVRLECYEAIKKHPEAIQAVIGFYAAYLNPNSSPETLNLSARAIGELGGKSAVPQLIDVLVTSYVEQRIVGSGTPTMMQGSGGLGLTSGTRTEKRLSTSPNRGVLAALNRLTGQNFQFDTDAWKRWLIQSQRTSSFNARRE